MEVGGLGRDKAWVGKDLRQVLMLVGNCRFIYGLLAMATEMLRSTRLVGFDEMLPNSRRYATEEFFPFRICEEVASSVDCLLFISFRQIKVRRERWGLAVGISSPR